MASGGILARVMSHRRNNPSAADVEGRGLARPKMCKDYKIRTKLSFIKYVLVRCQFFNMIIKPMGYV